MSDLQIDLPNPRYLFVPNPWTGEVQLDLLSEKKVVIATEASRCHTPLAAVRSQVEVNQTRHE